MFPCLEFTSAQAISGYFTSLNLLFAIIICNNYCIDLSPASAGDKSMLQAVLTKAKRWGLYGGKHPLELAKICETADTELF